MNLHPGSREERNWKPENSGFRKETFFQQQKFKDWKLCVSWYLFRSRT